MKIKVLQESDQLLSQIIELGNKYSNTLGFLPAGAIEQKMRQNKIIAAIENNKVLGYLLFDYNSRANMSYIVHLCVDELHRKKGIAGKLLALLESIVEDNVGGIRVRCRKDYEASKVWEKLGFRKITEVAGRSKKGSILEVWRKDVRYPDLFQTSIDPTSEKIKICFDYNIIADRIKPFSIKTSEAHAIFADWLLEYHVRYVTPEILVELKRDQPIDRSMKFKKFIDNLELVKAPKENYHKCKELIIDLFGESRQDESDLSHVAYCGASNIEYFVTNDKALIGKTEEIYDKVNVRIIQPSEPVLHADKLRRSSDYQPQRLSESEITIRFFAHEDFDIVDSSCTKITNENKKQFLAKLRHFASHPDKFVTNLVYSNDKAIGVISCDISSEKVIVNLLRLITDRHSSTIATGIVNWLLQQSIKYKANSVEIVDNYLSRSATEACFNQGFRLHNDNLIRWVNRGQYKIEEILKQINVQKKAGMLPQDYCKQIKKGLERANGGNDSTMLLNIEKRLWPLKFKELNMPTYIICIKPQYAEKMFEFETAEPDLFGHDSRLLLGIENAYYRSPRRNLICPARILWYVTKGHKKSPGVMAIRAASYLDEVHIDDPKVLYSRFQNLGIYKRKDVLEIAEKNTNKKVMAFVFSQTEVFNNPIPRKDLIELWMKRLNRKFSPQGPLEIDEDIYWNIYLRGIGASKKNG